MTDRRGFTLIELMVVIIIVGVLAAVAIPMMRGRIDSAKWSEANSTAGSLRRAVRTYIFEMGSIYDYSAIEGSLDTQSIYSAIGLTASDLNGTYFDQGDYSISSVNAGAGTCVVTVESSRSGGPTGTGTLSAAAVWTISE